MKRYIVILLVLVVLGVAGGMVLPVSNLLVGLPNSNSLIGMKTDNPVMAKAASALGKKCVNCHTTEYKLPFYANFPIAKQLIEKDIQDGTSYMNLKAELFPPDNKPVSEVTIAKNEYAIERGTMPPMRYLALHWNGALNAQEKADVLAWVQDVRKKHYATAGFPESVQVSVLQPVPLTHNEDPEKVALGEKLFHDKRLSKDNSLACAGCHALDKGGTDQKKFSEGVGGQVGDINAPTVFNSAFGFKQFWDGRAATLEEQADGPVNNPIEMASNWQEAIPKLQQDAELTAAFAAKYPEGYSKDTITSAIATYERTLITPNSKFDKFLAGDANAMSAEEKQGYQLFMDLSCATCHVGKALGGQSFEKMGRKGDYFGLRGNEKKPDNGRFNVTNNEEDRHKFKVPTLRNIALTAPYLHDSSTDKLDEVVHVMAKYMVGKDVSAAQAAQMVAFMRALTGEYKGQLLK